MLLLDVPPEIFQRIVGIYVTTVGVRQAAKSREVSKTFLGYINEEIFARQPASKFKAPVPKKLVEKNLALYLGYRTKVLNGASSFLPSLIQRTFDKMLYFLELGPDDPLLGPRAEFIEAITDIVIRHCPNAANLATAPTATQLKDHEGDCEDYITLAVALYSECKYLVATILNTGVDPWGSTTMFGYSVRIATEVNNVQLVKLLLSASDTYDLVHGKPLIVRERFQRRTIISSISLATSSGYWNIACALLTWHSQKLPKPAARYFCRWVESAIAANSLDFVKKVHELGYLKGKSNNYTRSIVSGLMASTQPERLLRFCIEVRLIDEHAMLPCYQSTGEQHLLNWAVHADNIPLAKAAFAVNAYANTSAALRAAIQKGSVHMVRLLLDHGADPEAPMHPPVEKSTCELAKLGSEIYRTLRSAILEKKKLLGTKYRPPHHLVRDKETKKDVYVQYTFYNSKL